MPLDDDSINYKGLTESEAVERVASGLSNRVDFSTGKTTAEIIYSNIFTYFNLIFAVLAVLLIFAGSYRNLTFMPVVIGNTLVGIVQELRAKHTLDKMKLLNAPRASVLRDGVLRQVSSEELVLDDIIKLSAGNQICADAVVLDGVIKADEALLTGEADEIEKSAGSELMSGSFVLSGSCLARLTRVGSDSYISRLTREAKTLETKEQSEMVRCINLIVKWLGILLIPIGLILFSQARYVNGETVRTSINSMVAAVIGMIPEGLYLLTTTALALGTIRLSRNKVLLNDMKSIEALARVDVLCVDKTGTITEPVMTVKEILWADEENADDRDSLQLLADFVKTSGGSNITGLALNDYITDLGLTGQRKPLNRLPFSSRLKYSLTEFDDGVFVMGAPEFVMRESYIDIAETVRAYTRKGCRVLLFGKYTGAFNKEGLSAPVVPICYIVLSNPVRANAPVTFGYFKEQGVKIKVISGDDAETVCEAAREAGIDRSELYIDAHVSTEAELAEAADKYTVFARVSPEQKRLIINALKEKGHTVAMTGDGVNDILAMKDADCSVALGSGSEAARCASQLVLLDSDFSHMPEVVLEGRRVVNNVQRSSSLFLVKNIFSVMLAVISAIFAVTYPFQPAQISFVAMFTIGVPGFLLTLEKNTSRIEGHFLKNVLMKALPAAVTDVFAVVAFLICGDIFNLGEGEASTAAVMLLSIVGFMILIRISKPMNKWRSAVLGINLAGWIFARNYMTWWFVLEHMSLKCTLLTIVFAFGSESVFRYVSLFISYIDHRYFSGKTRQNISRVKE